MTDAISGGMTPAYGSMNPPRQDLRETAKALEASFLSEMLKTAGLGQAREAFGGGIGEAQFTSFLTDEQARNIVDRGGIGLADAFYESLLRGQMENGK